MKTVAMILSVTIGLNLPLQAVSLKAEWANIDCKGGAFPGLRGTLTVPQDRSQPETRQIELPVIVVKSVSSQHPPTQVSPVETLIVYGSKEAGNTFQAKHGTMFSNAQWACFDDLGHMDMWRMIGDGMTHLIHQYIETGEVDQSKIGSIPKRGFTPQVTFYQVFQQTTAQN